MNVSPQLLALAERAKDASEIAERLRRMRGERWVAHPHDDDPERSNGYWMICAGRFGVASELSKEDAELICKIVNDARDIAEALP